MYYKKNTHILLCLCIRLVQAGQNQRATVNAVMGLGVPQYAGNFLTRWRTVSFSSDTNWGISSSAIHCSHLVVLTSVTDLDLVLEGTKFNETGVALLDDSLVWDVSRLVCRLRSAQCKTVTGLNACCCWTLMSCSVAQLRGALHTAACEEFRKISTFSKFKILKIFVPLFWGLWGSCPYFRISSVLPQALLRFRHPFILPSSR